jgi:hypothetical protein
MSKKFSAEYLNSLIGKKFNMLTIVSYKKKGKYNCNYFVCKCDCGNTTEIRANHLLHDNQFSCGCIRTKYTNRTIGNAIYDTWNRMMHRCYDTKHHKYARYGARGIKLCDEWKNNYDTFYNWAINNGFQLGLSIDRINNDGNYEPSNCRWATRKQQMRNTSRTKYLTYKGETRSMAEWCEILNLNYDKVASRLHRGKTVDQAFSN